MTIKSLVGAAAAAAMGLASTPHAHAAVLTQTEAFGSVVAMPDDHFFLEPFDTSLGTLTGVTITLTLTGTISLEPENLRTSFTYNHASAEANATLFGPDFIEMEAFLTTPTVTGTFAPGDPPVLASASGPVTNTLDVPSSDFSSFETLASVTIVVDGSAFWAAQTDPLATLSAVGDVPGSLTLVYTYAPAPVPEPSTALLVTAGLGALGFLSLRRQTLFSS
ncbi:choice-of-anchor E domain-containing protein [Roseiarcus sp.]|jgi:PEP-CTERM motif-containing protein|uniref:choice-of-anchor E domain-containing protein n=1 Tax=Roseiarcus sp. TaxID=1969460 RepID=UPI003D0B8186